MINKKQILLTKIDLLHISLEALIHNNITSKKLAKFTSIYQLFRKYENNKACNFIILLEYIKELKIIAKEYSVNTIATSILREYTKNDIQLTAKQYHNRFYNIYIQNKKKNYYKNKKLICNTYKLSIEEISILNLYIFTKLTRMNGTFVIIKYFYQ